MLVPGVDSVFWYLSKLVTIYSSAWDIDTGVLDKFSENLSTPIGTTVPYLFKILFSFCVIKKVFSFRSSLKSKNNFAISKSDFKEYPIKKLLY